MGQFDSLKPASGLLASLHTASRLGTRFREFVARFADCLGQMQRSRQPGAFGACRRQNGQRILPIKCLACFTGQFRLMPVLVNQIDPVFTSGPHLINPK